MAALAAAAKEVMAANPDTRPEQLPNIHITNGAGTHLKGHPPFSTSPSTKTSSISSRA